MTRCINLDWLEVYCLEDALNYPHDADFFRAVGFQVKEREYGTPMYEQMFTLINQKNEPFVEIRRKPKSDKTRNAGGLFDPYSAHVRLSNRACYDKDAVKTMQLFLEQYGFHYQRISRIDLALDFERFDSGDEPAKFIRRYLAGKYSKINQANLSAHGADRWAGRDFNSLSWGSKTSMVSTKLYDKTKELSEVKDKPYIRGAWLAAGLVDDSYHLTKKAPDGTLYNPRIFRLEFSLKSAVKNWVVIEDESGTKTQLRSFRNDLSCYDTKDKMLTIFFSLCNHYFHFKKYEREKRKDRCQDKVLFHPEEIAEFCEIDHEYTADVRSSPFDSLLSKLYQYRDSTYDKALRNACNVLIEDLEKRVRVHEFAYPYTTKDVQLMQFLISERLKHFDIPVNDLLERIKTQLELYHDLY